MKIKTIETKLNSFQLYSIFKDEPYCFFLDSGMDSEKLGQFSLIGFKPLLIFKSKNNNIEIQKGDLKQHYTGNPFHKLKELYSEYKLNYKSHLPFVGGFVGYLSYDLCHYIEKLPRSAEDDVNIPDCYLGLYDGVIIIDHKKNIVHIAALGLEEDSSTIINRIEKCILENKVNDIKLSETHDRVKLKSNFTKEEYINAVNKVKEYIRQGDIYQANLTQRFHGKTMESPYELYAKLRSINPAPFASFIDFGDGHILSSSPERFIRIKDNIIETRPIKGTRPRGKTPEEDAVYREELLNSQKDKAELLMIVDLERNDLGKVSKIGTVKVTELFHLEEYPTVYHLVATIQAEVLEDRDAIDCIMATFPGGSITGAPKIRAMEIIDELEPTQRNIYTGSIGYIGLNGDVDLNIVIRTIVLKDQQAYFQVGGGIVWDSNSEDEYQETFHKARALIRALNGECHVE